MRAPPLRVAFVLFVCSLVSASEQTPPKVVIAQRRRPPSAAIAQRAAIDEEQQEQLQVSITPRINVVQAPVDSNAILKCLISAQTNKFSQVFRVSWSRRRHSESQYEQLESESYNHDDSSVTKRVLNSSKRQADDNSTDRMQQLRDFLARTRQETNVISELLVEATLGINSVKPSDNASYFCTATVDRRQASVVPASQEARIELLVLSRPQVRLERVLAARDSKSALIVWTIVSDGNAHIKKTILMVRNDSQVIESSNSGAEDGAQQSSSLVLDADHRHWQRIDIQGEGQRVASSEPTTADSSDNNIVRADVDVTSIDLSSSSSRSSSDFTSSLDYNERAYNLSSLLPGVTYQLKLAASNDLGQSSWSELSTTMPNEIPAQISDVRVLGQTNDSITIGWRRPAYDRARTLRYEMQLFDLNRTLTLDANTNTTTSQPARTNFMFHFVNLNPGTDYHFHIRACSRAGCSAYSRPKLLASTQDGEPEEPLEVELSCELQSNQLTISWSPPRVTRGKLRAYTVELEARARYRNQSGAWTSDEWRRQFETADNQSVSFEPNSLPGRAPLVALQPNTNYTARVCAQNRARKCGRWSSQSSSSSSSSSSGSSSLAKSPSSCLTPAELPRELPANIRLGLKQIKTTQVGAQRPQAETLVLELPFISARNGSIDCLQIVLIRLPAAFDLSARPLSDYLPDDPADLQLHDFLELHNRPDQNDTSGAAHAYLADELDQVNQSGSSEELASGLKQILLGDGQHSHCSQVWAKLRTHSNSSSLPVSKHSLQPMDGPLIAQTYYSGFLRLVQLAPMQPELRNNLEVMQQRSKRAASQQLFMRYSNYFSPVKTGDLVPEVSMELLAASSLGGDIEQLQQTEEQPDSSTKSTFCDHQLIVDIQTQLNTTRPCQLVLWLSVSVKKLATSAYKLTGQILGEHVHLERLEQLISRSSAPLQLLQIGLLVFLVSLGLLFMVYLLLLPSRTLKRNRKRKLKQKQQAEQQRQPEVQKVINNMEQVVTNEGEDEAGFERRKSQQQQEIVHQQQQNMRALASSLGYRQVSSNEQSYGTLGLDPAACPIHSSPMSQQAAAHNNDDGSLANRRQSVHVCQPNQQPYHYHHNHYGHAEQTNGHQHQHHHHQSANQLAHQADELPRWQAHDGDRNCRTMRRTHNQNANLENHEQQPPPQRHQSIQSNGQTAHAGRQALNSSYTLTMQGDPLLALAKKINKSIPLALFQQVLEVRLKNNWLREEYEQLPRLASTGSDEVSKQLAMSKTLDDSGRHIKLRAQLVVSRDDSISALISGNDHYDGSLIKLQLPSVSSGAIEKQFICAKSPVDPDSVWDFWRLVYEREVGALVMLTPNEDTHTGELRCAQYWPTCDNEETTILSPCNEYVQQSDILPAKFKIRQETLEPSGDSAGGDSACEFKIRRLTLLVMATRPSENEHTTTELTEVKGTSGSGERESSVTRQSSSNQDEDAPNGTPNEDDDEELVIIERHLLHFQFLHWNAASASNQMRLIKFIELVNERHSRQCQLQASPGAHQWQQVTSQLPILVHCANGIGRSGLFTAMSYLIDDLSLKLSALSAMAANNNNNRNNQQLAAKLNLFQLVGRLRNQRDMLLSPYRFYEQLYQLTARCIPVQRHVRDRELQSHSARHE